MSDDELKSFEVSCKIGLANSADYLGRCIPKMGKIEFNAKAKKFSTRDPFQVFDPIYFNLINFRLNYPWKISPNLAGKTASMAKV
jgi:hypothetical protein